MKRLRRDWTAWSDSNVAGRTEDGRRSTQRGAEMDMMDRRRREANKMDEWRVCEQFISQIGLGRWLTSHAEGENDSKGPDNASSGA